MKREHHRNRRTVRALVLLAASAFFAQAASADNENYTCKEAAGFGGHEIHIFADFEKETVTVEETHITAPMRIQGNLIRWDTGYFDYESFLDRKKMTLQTVNPRANVAVDEATCTMSPSHSKVMDLTGKWTSDDGVYYIRQEKDQIFFYGEKYTSTPGPHWVRVAHGWFDHRGSLIVLAWADVPKGDSPHDGGLLVLKFSNWPSDALTVIQQTGAYRVNQQFRR
jgi:hypothetical protein